MNVSVGGTLQAKLVDLSLLSVAEVDWLNNYHSQVWEKVRTYLLLFSSVNNQSLCGSIPLQS